MDRAAPAPPRRHGPPPRASAGTRRGNPRASSRPSLSDPPVLRRPVLHSVFFLPSPALTLHLSVMAAEPPSPIRLEAPGPPEMRTPPASEAVSESTPKPGGGRLRFLNGCVPLSHQVAGHMYGKDKVGKWGWRGARRSLSVSASPWPTGAAWSRGPGWTPLWVCTPRSRPFPFFPRASRPVQQGFEKWGDF